VDDARLRVRSEEPLRRRRIAVALRVLLYVPHAFVVALWSALALAAAVVGWFALLFAGTLPATVHRFLAAYVRYSGQVAAWFFLLSGRYPGPRRTTTHPFAIDVPPRMRQPRLVTFFRAVLVLPALLLASVFRVVLTLSAVAAWFVALALGRTTAGLQELGTFCLRYELETVAYLLLLTPRYPRLAPG
jgi:Domain of unknown function (DUF4389)